MTNLEEYQYIKRLLQVPKSPLELYKDNGDDWLNIGNYNYNLSYSEQLIKDPVYASKKADSTFIRLLLMELNIFFLLTFGFELKTSRHKAAFNEAIDFLQA